MTKKKSFPLRINPDVLAAMQRWADDELRSVNAQIEFVLRQALVDAGRVKLTQKVITELTDADSSNEPSEEAKSDKSEQ
ncbi:hypothetical protein J1N51_12840 [Psychrosphaera ytuae]|uniref:Arc family DNA binding domain-containing protein n=1 Tax=Psychrosphaera ytuae TaxID=2820710 RepID=A0A975DB44_9GAMM|nr:hypothetical protein [Psychrosphaera ytuae]QTH63593.1 hypothetical protein J1N51_12840 [Psychrosphaera ytuae]